MRKWKFKDDQMVEMTQEEVQASEPILKELGYFDEDPNIPDHDWFWPGMTFDEELSAVIKVNS